MPQHSKAKIAAAKTASNGASVTGDEQKEADDELRKELRKADLGAFDGLLSGAFVDPPGDPSKATTARRT